MSLELQEPTFDRPFEEIYRELRERIPRYNPAWTNYNDSDPGITLVQLFAWLAEMTLHRMGQVPRKNYLKFAQLLGLELSPARPATVRVVFTAKEAERPSTIPAGARLAAGSVLFETAAPLDVIGAKLDSTIVVADGVPAVIPPPEPGAEVQPFYPFGRFPDVGNAVYFGFKPSPANPEPFPRQMTFLALRPPRDTDGEPQRAGDALAGLIPPAELVWEFRPSKSQNVWERLNVFDDRTTAFTRDGYVKVEGPRKIEPSVEPSLAALVSEPRYWLRVRIDQGGYARAPRLEHLVPNAVDAVNLVTEPERVLGQSSGRAGQTFELPQRPVDAASLQLVVRAPSGAEQAWERRDDFYESKKTSPHFLLDPSSGKITFGDGMQGDIPTAGADIVAKVWRYGGGKAGNDVAAGAVTTMIEQVPGIESVTNLRAAAGGADEEDLDAFLRRAPSALRSQRRAVTAADFREIALQVDGVSKVKALPGRHPDFPDVQVPGAITVVIVPDSDTQPPRPSAELIRSVASHLDSCRLITTEVYVAAPRFIEIRIEARLFADPEAAFDAVARAARERLDKFLDPRARGFGVDVSLAEIYRELLGTREAQTRVRTVEDLIVYVEGVPHEIKGPIRIPPDALTWPGNHLIVVRPDADEGARE
jgi:predicted phage baseplate assembly protein